MYKTIISIKRNLPDSSLKEIIAIADKAFDNRAGKVINTSSFPFELIYAGEGSDYGCLIVGMCSLDEHDSFKSYVDSWQWIDEDPDECCDVLKEFAIPVR